MNWKPEFDLYVGQLFDADIGCKVGFNRVAVNHFILAPGQRTSSPHAENAVTDFWIKMGYLPTGNSYEFKGEAKITHVKEFQKEIKK